MRNHTLREEIWGDYEVILDYEGENMFCRRNKEAKQLLKNIHYHDSGPYQTSILFVDFLNLLNDWKSVSRRNVQIQSLLGKYYTTGYEMTLSEDNSICNQICKRKRSLNSPIQFEKNQKMWFSFPNNWKRQEKGTSFSSLLSFSLNNSPNWCRKGEHIRL